MSIYIIFTIILGASAVVAFMDSMGDFQDYLNHWDYDAQWCFPWHEWAPVPAIPWDLILDVNDEVVASAGGAAPFPEFDDEECLAPTAILVDPVDETDMEKFEAWLEDGCWEMIDQAGVPGSDWSTFFGDTTYDPNDVQTAPAWPPRYAS